MKTGTFTREAEGEHGQGQKTSILAAVCHYFKLVVLLNCILCSLVVALLNKLSIPHFSQLIFKLALFSPGAEQTPFDDKERTRVCERAPEPRRVCEGHSYSNSTVLKIRHKNIHV